MRQLVGNYYGNIFLHFVGADVRIKENHCGSKRYKTPILTKVKRQ